MKKRRIILCLMAILTIFCFFGVTFGSGGPEDPACPTPLPDPDAGKFLRGEFTVSRDKGPCHTVPECAHYNVHIFLKKGKQRHLFSFPVSLGTGDLCSYDAEDFIDAFKRVPCSIEMGLPFGFSGVPVIAELEITTQDSCETSDEMILGTVVIRVVPLE